MDAHLDALVDDVAALIDIDPQRAIALLDGVPEDLRDGRTRALGARAALLAGDDDACIALARAALDDPALGSRDRALAATALAAAIIHGSADMEAVIGLLQQTIRRVSPADADRVASRLAQVHLFQLDLDACERLHDDVPQERRSTGAQLRMTSCRCLLLALAGRVGEATAVGGPLSDLATVQIASFPWESIEAWTVVGTVRVLGGDHAGALAVADGFEALDPRLRPLAAMARGEVALERGDLTAAVEELTASLDPQVQRTGIVRHHLAVALLAAGHGFRGDLAPARDALAQIAPNVRRALPIVASHVARADALTHALAGLPAHAIHGLTQHGAWAMARGMDADALRSFHLALRLGAPWNQLSVVERLRVDGAVDDALLAHLLAWGGQRLDATEAAARRFDELGLRLVAAEAWAHVAVLAQRAGDDATAAAAIDRSRAGVLACGAMAGPTVAWLPAAVRAG